MTLKLKVLQSIAEFIFKQFQQTKRWGLIEKRRDKLVNLFQPAAELSEVQLVDKEHETLEPGAILPDTPMEAQAKGDTEAIPDIPATGKVDTAETATPEVVFVPPLASTAKKEGGVYWSDNNLSRLNFALNISVCDIAKKVRYPI